MIRNREEIALRDVLVIDDETIITTLLKETLEGRGFSVLTANSGIEAVKILKDYEPDIAIIDLHLGSGPNGFDVAQVVKKRHPYSAIVLLSKYQAPNYICSSHSLPPKGAAFIPKDQIWDIDDFIASINDAIENPEATTQLPSYWAFDTFSQPQIEVLQYLAQGLTNTEIAKRRKTTLKAVERAVTSIYNALGIDQHSSINPRAELVRRYIEVAGIPTRL